MTKPGRNDLCPCGSGKKYKKCCLQEAEAAAAKLREEQSVIPHALGWVTKRYPEELADAVDNHFFGSLDDEDIDILDDLDDDLQAMIDVNVAEWSLADAQIMVKGELVPLRTLVLGQGGPLLSAPARTRLERLVERPMSLYEIRRVEPGVGVEVADVLRPEEPVVWVQERSASKSLVRYDIMGTRLMRHEDGWMFTGACYLLPRDIAATCQEEIHREMEGEEWDSQSGRELLSAIIRYYWLTYLLDKGPMPEMVDAATKAPIMLVTDHYRVTDWAALIAALAEQPDVEGDRENGWVRFVELEDGMRRSRASLNVNGPDSLEVFCRTLNSADEARPWLEQLAGDALKYRTREIMDPRSPKALASASEPRRSDIPPEVEAQLVREMLMKHYETWPDTELPALGGKTPRQAVASLKGRKAVVELLKEFEQFEARKVAEGGEPFDFGFLWDALGLGKERKG